MLEAAENIFNVFIAVTVIAMMLAVAVTIVALCALLAIPIAVYQAMQDPFSSVPPR